MTSIGQWARRLRLLVRRPAVERAMNEELLYHIDREVAERVQAGLPPDEARRTTLRDFGGLERAKEEARDARGIRPLEDTSADLRYAARILGRNPGFTAAAVLTFALGIGATTAIFSVVYGVLLRPLPYANPDGLVVLWEHNLPRSRTENVVSVANFEAWRLHSQSFAGMAALVPRSLTLTGGPEPERVAGADVSPGYFRLLGVTPALGADFQDADEHAAGPASVILSHGLWTRRFGADPAVIGRVLPAGGDAFTIVGVMPPGFDPPQFGWLSAQDFWVPFVPAPANRSWGRALLVVGRLRAGVAVEQARAEMTMMGARLAAEVAANDGWSIDVVPLTRQITGGVRTALLVWLGAVALLLLIAVINVATVTLSWMRRRAPELRVRRSLGATDGRLFRQLFAQSALVGVAGAAVGLLAARPGVQLLGALAPASLPRVEAIRLDVPVLLTTTAVALLATLAFGTLAGRRGKGDALMPADGDARVSGRARNDTLVVGEIAVALVLAIMASLMARSVAGLRAVDLGFSADGIVAARLTLAGGDSDPARQRAGFDRVLERLRALPGVEQAGIMSTRPLGGVGVATSVIDPRQPQDATAPPTIADVRYVDAAALAALRIPLRRGATFSERDPGSGLSPVIISDGLAEAIWPGRDAIGQTLSIALNNGIAGSVVGVVADLHLTGPRTPVRPLVFLPVSRFPSNSRDLVVRTDGTPAALIPLMREALAVIEPGSPLYQAVPLADLLDASLAADRFTMLLLSAFAAMALLLGGVGVFGVISSDVTRRRREFGIRLALGATGRSIVAMVVRQMLVRASVGLFAGASLAVVLARAMAALLFGVGPTDPASFLVVSGMVATVVIVATLVPAVQAIRSSPLSVLREN